MKIFWKIVIVLIICVPIFICWRTLQTVWEEPDDLGSGDYVSDDYYNDYEDNTNNNSGDVLGSGNSTDNSNTVTASNLGDGVEYDITGLNPISKVYENAEVSISLANVYKSHDVNSEVVGKLEKGTSITVQNYDNGWSTITNYTVSGWMKTDNIKLPNENDTTMTLNPTGEDTRVGTVKVDDALNVRESASTTANVITTLNNGTTVTILEEKDGWYNIKWSTTTGWVKADYVTVN